MKKSRKRAFTKSLTDIGMQVAPGTLIVYDLVSLHAVQLPKTELESAAAGRSLIEDAYARSRDVILLCGCRNECPARAFVRRRGDIYQICRCPVHGQDHALDCENWAPQAFSSGPRPTLTLPKDVLLDGLFRPVIIGARVSDGTERVGREKQHEARTRSQSASTLAAELLGTIEAAGLNIYRPSLASVDWTVLARRIAETLGRAESRGTGGARAPRVIHDANLINLDLLPRSIANGQQPIQAALLIGSVRGVERIGSGFRILLEGESLPITISSSQWRYAIRHSPSRYAGQALKALGTSDRAARVVGAFAVTRGDDRHVLCHRAGLCVTSQELIPVESSHELEMTNFLVAQNRWWEKPLRITAGEEHRHDVVLLDVVGLAPGEVFGMLTPDYVQNAKRLEAMLLAKYPNRHFVWWAASGEPMPGLPPPDHKEEQ